jgi:hypothetical protein
LQETVEKLTKFSFTWGPVKFNVTLPKEATITLPVKLRGALSIAMKWKAETSGAFSFSLSLDGVPSFGIQASTKYDVEKKTVTTGLMFTIVGDVCDINVPPSVYSNMKTAGEKLKAALENYAPPAAAPSDLDRAKDVGKAIGALFDAVQEVEKSKGKCRKGPTLQFGPTAEFSTDPQSGARPKIGLGLTLTF